MWHFLSQVAISFELNQAGGESHHQVVDTNLRVLQLYVQAHMAVLHASYSTLEVCL